MANKKLLFCIVLVSICCVVRESFAGPFLNLMMKACNYYYGQPHTGTIRPLPRRRELMRRVPEHPCANEISKSRELAAENRRRFLSFL